MVILFGGKTLGKKEKILKKPTKMNYVKVCTHMYILQTGSSCLIMYMCAYTLYSTLLITINFLGYYRLKGPQGRKRWGRK